MDAKKFGRLQALIEASPWGLTAEDEVERMKLALELTPDMIDRINVLKNTLRDIATNSNGAEYGHWANRKAERALRGGK